jgi:hypothetical protein
MIIPKSTKTKVYDSLFQGAPPLSPHPRGMCL